MTQSLHAPHGDDVVCATDEALLVVDVVLLTAPHARGTRKQADLWATIGAAVFVDLALRQLVEARSGVFSAYLLALGDRPPEDRILRPAWEHVAAHPTNARTALPHVGELLLGSVRDRLEEAGHLQFRSRPALGILPQAPPVPVGERHSVLLERLRTASAGGGPPDTHAALLIELLSAGGKSVWPPSRGTPIQRESAGADDEIRMLDTVAAIVRSLAETTA